MAYPLVLVFVSALASSALAAHPFRVEDMQKIQRIGDAHLSPDGKWVAFIVRTSDVARNKGITNLWIASAVHGSPHPLTFVESGSTIAPRWSPDSRNIFFLSDRVEGTTQIFRLAMSGGEAQQITNIATGVGAFIVSPNGKNIAFTATVYPDCSDTPCNERKKKEDAANPVKVRVISTLPFRRWDSWVDGQRSHVFVTAMEGGEAKDITPGDVDSPIWNQESGSEELAFSPDGNELCFSRFTENESVTGNSDLYTVAISGGTPKQVTTNKGSDTRPLYSPDGRYIAYLATVRPMQESDLARLVVYDRRAAQHVNLTESLDRSIVSYTWSRDGRSLWITMEDHAQMSILKLDVASGETTRIYGEGSSGDELFHYRWNPQLFAAAGDVVIEPNFHGSSGFGLKFQDSIKGQWGGAPYEDTMKAVDVALTWPYVDRTRIAAAGGSYGGYLANWIAGHTDRFRTMW